MANLGTLWFGSDIDLTALRNKIQSGNQSILNALKMDYDPASYQQMVSKLRSTLDREVFQIRIDTNASAIQQNLKNTLNSISNNATTPRMDLSGLKGISGMKSNMASLREEIILQEEKVRSLRKAWQEMKTQYGQSSAEAKNARNAYQRAADTAFIMRTNAGLLGVDIKRATIAQSELNKQTKEAAKAARQWNSDHMRLNATLAGGVHISTQLGSALSSLFALDYMRQFLGYVIEIGGQLEKQRISIGAILGDTVKANHLFEQIKGLALKSPFGVVELDQYTKQLSAYGFRYNELYDMTKRLADISAGAGTDIGRLTLALGHVRSATYLTGITLRQFSMNNIPMLKMLADYYTEVEKKAVSTAEVQQRISKRQVSYEDVIEQIRRLTDEGGMFYNMQEKISESLAARYKNLKDAMDIMYGEMAEGFVGDQLKNLADILLKTTRHWREIANVMGVAAAMFMLNKIRIGINTAAMQGNTSATLKNIMASKQLSANNLRAAATYRTLTAQENIAIMTSNSLTVADIKQAMTTKDLTKSDVLRLVTLKRLKIAQAMHLAGVNGITAAEIRAAAAASRWRVAAAGLQMSLKNAFAGIGAGTWTTIGLMAGMELYSAWDQWNQRIDDKSKEMKDLIKSRIIDLQKMQREIDTNGMPKDQVALKGRIDEMKQVLANSEAYTKTIDEQLSKASNLPEQYNILVGAIDKAVEKNRQMLDVQSNVAEMIKASTGDFTSTDFGENLDWLFNDDINKNMQQTLDSYKTLRTVIDSAWEYKDAIKNVIEEMVKSGQISEQFAEQLKKAPFEEQIRLLAESGYWQTIVDKIKSTDLGFVKFADRIKEASDGVTERWDEIANDDIPRMMKKVMQERNMDEKELNKWALNNVDDFKIMLEGISDQLGVQEPEIRRRLKRLFYDYVRFGQLEKGLAEGASIGASIFSDETLQKLLEEDEKADITDRNNNQPKKNDGNKDAELEKAKTKLAEYKAFLSEYKKYREVYSKEKAIGLLEQLFPNLKGQGTNLVDNYVEMLDKLRDSLEMTSEARKKLANDVNKTKTDTLFDREKEAIKKNADAMQEYIKKMEDQWKLYRSLMKKSGGNQEFAELAFNPNGAIWDETAKKMLERFNQRGQELGVVPVGFRWDMNEKEFKKALVDAKGQVQEELVKLALEIQKIISGNYTQFLEDSASAYQKSLTASQKLVELERQRTELIKKRDKDNDQSPEKLKGWNAQISATDKEIAEQKWEAFKETEQWGRIFANLDNISTSTLENMLNKLQEIVPQLRLSEEATKYVYEAMEKLQDKLVERNPFSAIGASISNASSIKKYRNQAEKQGDLLANAELSKLLKVKLGSKVTKNQLNDAIKKEEGNLPKGLDKLAKSFKNLQDVLQPVIDLFDSLGNEDLSNFFSIGNDALGAAANFSSGLSQLSNLFPTGKNGEQNPISQALGAAGPYGAAAAAGLSIVTSLFAMQDAELQEEIEASQTRQKEMENLTKNLEKVLERTLGGIYNTSATEAMVASFEREIRDMTPQMLAKTFGTTTNQIKYKNYITKETLQAVKNAQQTKKYYDAAYASLLAQRDELKHQLEMESEKKNSDTDKMADFRQQLVEMEDEIDNFARDLADTLYSIDVKSWASDLGDALFEAWQKGEDGADAFKRKASEIMSEVAKNIAVTKLIETAMDDVLKAVVSEMKRTKGLLDEQSVNVISQEMAELSSTLPESFNTLMDGLNEGMKRAGLMDMKELAEDSESDSTNAIGKAITEQDTSLWASYWNAMRADLSVIREGQNVHLPVISAAVQRTSVLAETQVTHLQQIAANTLRNADAADRIYDILHSVAPDGTRIRIA